MPLIPWVVIEIVLWIRKKWFGYHPPAAEPYDPELEEEWFRAIR